MVNKHCCYGNCTNDSRKIGKPGHPEMEGVFFIPFVKPARQLEKCKEWIKLCGRPHDRLNIEKLGSHKGKNIYICSKHFVGGKGPTDEYPNPIRSSSRNVKKVRKPPRSRESKPINASHLSASENSYESFLNDHNYTTKVSSTDLTTESFINDHNYTTKVSNTGTALTTESLK